MHCRSQSGIVRGSARDTTSTGASATVHISPMAEETTSFAIAAHHPQRSVSYTTEWVDVVGRHEGTSELPHTCLPTNHAIGGSSNPRMMNTIGSFPAFATRNHCHSHIPFRKRCTGTARQEDAWLCCCCARRAYRYRVRHWGILLNALLSRRHPRHSSCYAAVVRTA